MSSLVPRVFWFFGQRGKPEESGYEIGKRPILRFQTDTLKIRESSPISAKFPSLEFIQGQYWTR